MSEENNGSAETQQDVPEEAKSVDVVSKSAYEEVTRDMHKNKQKAKQLELALNELKTQMKAQEEAKLREKEQYKELFEKRDAELEQTRREVEEEKTRYMKSVKISALKQELGASVRDEYLGFADLNSITINDDGMIDSESLSNVANEFRKQHGQLIPTDQSVNVTGHAPTNDEVSNPANTSGMSAAELVRHYANQKN